MSKSSKLLTGSETAKAYEPSKVSCRESEVFELSESRRSMCHSVQTFAQSGLHSDKIMCQEVFKPQNSNTKVVSYAPVAQILSIPNTTKHSKKNSANSKTAVSIKQKQVGSKKSKFQLFKQEQEKQSNRGCCDSKADRRTAAYSSLSKSRGSMSTSKMTSPTSAKYPPKKDEAKLEAIKFKSKYNLNLVEK